MTRALRQTSRFKRDVKAARKRGKNLDRLRSVILGLQQGRELDPSCRPHRLSGDWSGFWECHLEPDWLLIWYEVDDEIVLVRTGRHVDLFG